MLFKVTPALITNWLPIDTTGTFVVIEGVIRVSIFLIYLLLISLLPDLRRVFQYHAAEHKAINAYEAGEELTPENVQKIQLDPPALRNSLFALGDGDRDLRLRIRRPAGLVLADPEPVLLLPVIAGLAYELIRFAGKHQDNAILMMLLAPGLWLQRLTTRQPSLDQIEVSIRALAGGAPP